MIQKFKLRLQAYTRTSKDPNWEVLPMKGYPNGGVLLPLLWNFVMDGLESRAKSCADYADDIVMSVQGKVWRRSTASYIMNKGLWQFEGWCKTESLRVNVSMSMILPYTRKRKGLCVLCNLRINDKRGAISSTTTYLRITLDSKLAWNEHLSNTLCKGRWAISQKRVEGDAISWGLTSKALFPQ